MVLLFTLETLISMAVILYNTRKNNMVVFLNTKCSEYYNVNFTKDSINNYFGSLCSDRRRYWQKAAGPRLRDRSVHTAVCLVRVS